MEKITLNKLYNDVIQEFDKRKLKSERRKKELEKIREYIQGNFKGNLACLKDMDRQTFKANYAEYRKKEKLNSAESSAINTVFDIFLILSSKNISTEDNQNELLICDNKEHIISEKKKNKQTKDKKDRDDFGIFDMTEEKFYRLIESKKIIIKDSSKAKVPPVSSKSEIMPLTDNSLKPGLEAWCGETPYVLILGTLPGDKSLAAQAYYQDKSHNAFYKIMESLFERQSGLSDKDFIINNHIALWDCMKMADRKGSLDANIKDYVANDVEKFLFLHPTITTIVLNGTGDTTKTFEKNFSLGELKHRYRILSLPSTSNSNSISFDEKLKNWRIIKEIIEAIS